MFTLSVYKYMQLFHQLLVFDIRSIMIRSFAVLSLFCLTVNAISPGIKTLITSKGLDYCELSPHLCCVLLYTCFSVNKVTLPVLKQQLQDLQISDVSGSSDVNVIGKIKYSLSK